MKLNEYLKIKLGIVLEDKYNELAIKEINSNPNQYPNIAYEFEGHNKSFNSKLFDCDDESCASIDQAMELYKAFLMAFYKENKDKGLTVNYVSCGYGYLRSKSLNCLFDPYLNYSGLFERRIFPNKIEVVYKHFLNYPDGLLNENSTDTISKIIPSDNNELLKLLTRGLFDVLANYNHLDLYSDFLFPIVVDNDKESFGYTNVEFKIGKNYLRFFSTEGGFGLFGGIRTYINDVIDFAKINSFEQFKNAKY